MAWTTPRTWSVGETVTAAIMNAHVRDNFAYLGGADGSATTPPGSPVAYQRWVYDANAVQAGCEWKMIYRSDLDATDPWHFNGGAPVVVRSTATRASASFSTPRAGRWRVTWAGAASVSSGGDASVFLVVGGSTIDTAASAGNSCSGGGSYDTGHLAASTAIACSTAGTNWAGGFATVAIFPVKIA